MQTGEQADRQVAEASEAWKAANDTDAAVLLAKCQSAMREADDADDALIDLVRAELQGKGPALGDWEPIAPVNTDAPRRS
jgi:thioredoxin-like negative regulator of GroEL